TIAFTLSFGWAETVTFPSGEVTLHGVLYKPEGIGPFPAVIYNHGSAPGMMSEQAFAVLGPVFASHGWVFFGPYRRGQGLSDSAGGAQSWAEAPELQSRMTRAVRNAKAPIFFFQAANDFDLSPSKTLSAEMNAAGKTYKLKIYPAYGDSPRDGHSFGYFGS